MKEDFNTLGREIVLENMTAPTKPILTVDVEKYQAYLDGADMTEAQKAEFLEAMWSIIVSFVDLGFGVHPLQEVCGENADCDSKSAKNDFDMIGSDTVNKEELDNNFKP
ncbi:MAG: hypothetical protein ACEPO2_02015 [Pelagibaca sp.]